MAIVLPGSFVYLAHMHTGSSAVAEALKTIDGAFAAYDKRHGIGHHATLEEVKQACQVLKKPLTGAETVFTVIRNPYDVLTSMYVNNMNHFQMRHASRRLGRDPTLREFLGIWLELNRPPYMRDKRIFYHAKDASVLLRYERLQNDLNAFIRKAPNTPGVLPLNLKSEDKEHWTSYFDDDTYAFVNEHFQTEFVQFGYCFIQSNDQLT